MTFTHSVAEETRKRSLPCEEYACFFTPGGRPWRYVQAHEIGGAAWVDEDGNPVLVARWMPFPSDPYEQENLADALESVGLMTRASYWRSEAEIGKAFKP